MKQKNYILNENQFERKNQQIIKTRKKCKYILKKVFKMREKYVKNMFK